MCAVLEIHKALKCDEFRGEQFHINWLKVSNNVYKKIANGCDTCTDNFEKLGMLMSRVKKAGNILKWIHQTA